MEQKIAAMIKQAELAEGFGDYKNATDIWREIEHINPNHPRILVRNALEKLRQGQLNSAREMLLSARISAPDEPSIPLHLGLIHKLSGQLNEALVAINEALALDPYLFLGLLWKGAVLEQMGLKATAMAAYKNAIKTAPPIEKAAPDIKSAIKHAENYIEKMAREKQSFLYQETAQIRAKFTANETKRALECLDIMAGVTKPYVHDGILFNFPQLPAIPFHERKHFPWLEGLEAASNEILNEAQGLIQTKWEKFAPYVQTPKDQPTNQWEYLNYNPEWSTVHFYRDGQRFDDVHDLCPKTSAMLESLPLARQADFGPTAVFSVLQPHTHIPPHTGSTNVRLLCHLPLVIPENCWFRVGNEKREWKFGEAFVFDDSIEHEAMNDSDKVRFIMIFDIWNPLLTEAEREIVNGMLLADNEFNKKYG